jgi:uncharacterized protein YbjQ (UPF0145 family)
MTAELIGPLIGVGLPLLFVLLGLCVGTLTEKLHLRSLAQREKQFADMMQSNTRRPPEGWHVYDAELVDGQAVIASDYFKTFAAALRNLFGGEVRSFESLMMRARREAALRMLGKARKLGANAVCNIRMETSTIGRGMGARKGIASAEIHVYGTALRMERFHDPQSP